MNIMNEIRLLSVNNYHYVRGGAERIFIEQNRALRDAGYSVAEFCMSHPLNDNSHWESLFISNLEYNESDLFLTKIDKATRVIWNRESRKNISSLIRQFSPTVVHIHNVYHHISFSILPVLKRHRLPVIMTLHDLKLLCPAYSSFRNGAVCHKCSTGSYHNAIRYACVKNSRLGSLVAAADNFLARKIGLVDRYVDVFVVPSKFYQNLFSRFGVPIHKLIYIPNFAADINNFPNAYLRDRFLYFGRLSYEKGVHVLLNAAHISGVKLSLAGSGPEESSLKDFAAKLGVDCEFLGHLDGAQLTKVISNCRAVVVPSISYENAPLAVLEAMKCGRAVVASRIGGISELVEEGVTGFLFNPGDHQALAQHLRTLTSLTDDQWRAMEAASASSASSYSLDSYLNRITDLYKSFSDSKE